MRTKNDYELKNRKSDDIYDDIYQSPTIEVVDIEVEENFFASGNDTQKWDGYDW